MLKIRNFGRRGNFIGRKLLFQSRSPYTMAAPNRDPSCIFCKIIDGKIPSSKVFETEKTYAFLDVNPLSKGHCLVIPKYHCAKLDQLPPEEMADLGPILVKVAKAIGCTDYNILQNNGAPAHQEVEHVHFHIIPKPNAAQGLGIKWPATKANPKELTDLCEDIKGRL